MRIDGLKSIAITELHVHGAETTTGNETGKDLGKIIPEKAVALLVVSAVGGDADETYDFKIEGSDDGTTWDTANPAGTFTQVLQTGGATFERINLTRQYRHYRAVRTLAGTTPSVTYSIWFIGTDAIREPITQV